MLKVHQKTNPLMLGGAMIEQCVLDRSDYANIHNYEYYTVNHQNIPL